MKTLTLSALVYLFTAGGMPLSAEESAAPPTLQLADKEVGTALTRVHRERKNYLETVQASGQDSPQSVAAKERLDKARAAWRSRISQRQTIRQEARREISRRNRARRPPPARP